MYVFMYVCMYLSMYVSMHNVLLAFHNFYLLLLCFYVCLGYFNMYGTPKWTLFPIFKYL